MASRPPWEIILLHPPPEGREPCPILLGEGVHQELVRRLAADPLGVVHVVITDENVAEIHAAPLARALRARGLGVELLSFRPGEASKTRATKAGLEDELARLGAGRDAAVIAVGGGVVGDVAGFVAATYHRGIPYLQVPTTVVAMADASVGGKTGIDLPAGKNLVGAFHHPRGVFADLGTLRTLAPREVRAGLAEVAKAGLVGDPALVEQLEEAAPRLAAGDLEPLGPALGRAIRFKAGVVARDPGERGERAILNFGHTLGHALEAATGYRLRHGEAVAIGMAAEAAIAVHRGLLQERDRARLVALLQALGLPWRAAGLAAAPAVVEVCRRDKKGRAGKIRMALLAGIGRPAGSPPDWTQAVEEAEIEAVLVAEG